MQGRGEESAGRVGGWVGERIGVEPGEGGCGEGLLSACVCGRDCDCDCERDCHCDCDRACERRHVRPTEGTCGFSVGSDGT